MPSVPIITGAVLAFAAAPEGGISCVIPFRLPDVISGRVFDE